jgi:hypothetical protein
MKNQIVHNAVSVFDDKKGESDCDFVPSQAWLPVGGDVASAAGHADHCRISRDALRDGRFGHPGTVNRLPFLGDCTVCTILVLDPRRGERVSVSGVSVPLTHCRHPGQGR